MRLFNCTNPAKQHPEIFNFTEIDPKNRLPKVKTSSGFRSQKSNLDSTRSSWVDFLKRIPYTGNLSPRQVTPSTRELFERVEEKAKKDFLNKPLGSYLKSCYSTKDIESFKHGILHKKSLFNKIHNSSLQKAQILEGLLNKFDELTAISEEPSASELLRIKTQECEELQIGLENEKVTKETLVYMANRLKETNIENSKPVVKTRQMLAEVKQSIFSLQNILLQINAANFEYEKELKTLKEDYSALVSHKKQVVGEKSKIYEGKIKMKLGIDQEKEKNQLILKQMQDKKRLKELEEKLNGFKNVEFLEAEILSFEEFCAGEEEKFKKIQKVTNIRRVGEVLDHYNYLMDNKEKLMDSVNNSLLQIEKLNFDRIKLSEELCLLKFNTGDQILEPAELQNIEKEFSRKNHDLENYEERVKKLEEIIVAGVNTFSKIGKMLKIEPDLGKIRKNNLEKCISACLEAFDKVIESSKDSKDQNSSNNTSSEISLGQNQSFHLNFNYIE